LHSGPHTETIYAPGMAMLDEHEQWPTQGTVEQQPQPDPDTATSKPVQQVAQTFNEAMRNAHATLLGITERYAEAWEKMTDDLRRTVSLILPYPDVNTDDLQWTGADFQVTVSGDGQQIHSQWSQERGNVQAFAAALIAADRRAQQIRAQQQPG
jgi:hypothetical protein